MHPAAQTSTAGAALSPHVSSSSGARYQRVTTYSTTGSPLPADVA
jgi:hypothetical protein